MLVHKLLHFPSTFISHYISLIISPCRIIYLMTSGLFDDHRGQSCQLLCQVHGIDWHRAVDQKRQTSAAQVAMKNQVKPVEPLFHCHYVFHHYCNMCLSPYGQISYPYTHPGVSSRTNSATILYTVGMRFPHQQLKKQASDPPTPRFHHKLQQVGMHYGLMLPTSMGISPQFKLGVG